MLLITFLLVIFSFALLYKHYNNRSNLYLIGIILTWSLSLFALIIYLNSLNYYYNIANRLFNIPSSIWRFLSFLDMDIDRSVRFLNLGAMMFPYFLIGFSIYFTHLKIRLPYRTLLIILIIIPLIQIFYYDNYFYKLLFPYLIQMGSSTFKVFNQYLQLFFRFINLSYICVSFYLLIIYYIKYPKIKFIRNNILYTILSLIPVIIIYVFMFSWLPMHLVRVSLIPGFFNYVVPDLNKYILLFNIFPYIVFVALLFLLISIYKYNAIDTYYKQQTHSINHSINEASLGIKAMTHSIKNHLLAIQTEAHFLSEKYPLDPETVTSLSLITASCTHAFESINRAAEQLKVVKVDLKIQSCYEPLQLLLKRLDHTTMSSKLTIHTCPLIPSAYLDSYYFSEALYNIVDNAFDAIKQTSDGYVHISLNQVEHFAVFSISDNGCGMSEDTLNSLFTPFHSTKNALSNWGIGLSYCHKIISAHAGMIQVESKVGVGTTFEIMVPTLHTAHKEVTSWKKKLLKL